VIIVETERLVLREIDSAADAEFIFELLNSPKFIEFIGDRGVRSVTDAASFIDTKYRQSYIDHGFGLYTVERTSDKIAVGICGLVRRNTLPAPDMGFAFLPKYERMGYGFESAAAVIDHARDAFGLTELLAITTMDNEASGLLLKKLGFIESDTMPGEDNEKLKVFRRDL
jgi:[ribosomal protein S5]-alanine N-acetyltransferase